MLLMLRPGRRTALACASAGRRGDTPVHPPGLQGDWPCEGQRALDPAAAPPLLNPIVEAAALLS